MNTTRARWTFVVCALAIGCSEPAASPSDAGPRPDGGPGVDSGGTPAGDAGASGGCGIAPTIATGEWVEQSIEIGGTTRPYFVRLPNGYDPSRAYPVVHAFHGCSDSATREDNNVPTERESGADAIHVRGRAAERCWDTAPDGADMDYVDAVFAQVDATYCVDADRRLLTGYSGGAFMAHRVACIRGDLVRGVATIAGGQAGRSCTGDVAALLIHDLNDGTVDVSASVGTRDAYLEANGCSDTTTPYDPDPCVQYDGCSAGLPVVWCQTEGQDHSRQDGLAAPIFWDFLSSL